MVQRNRNVCDDAVNKEETGEELIYSNAEARVSRRTLVGIGKVIVKQANGMQAIQQLNHEASILRRLADVAGVTHFADVPSEPNTLFFKDDGGVSLSEFLRAGAFSATQVIDFAGAMTHTLSDIHKAGVIHKDICPDNILINVVSRQPTLINFSIASVISEQIAEHKGTMAGTLAYMSPEQTGRTGRAADQRSDLYSLGITLYELLTRRKPFESNDLLELVHDHLVRVPTAPHAVNADVPPIVSELVMRLLEKEPDRRYQSADGLLQDLNRISKTLAAGESASFALGQFDFGARLNPPSQLIGRDAELSTLRDALTRTADGRFPCLLIAGPAGVGKSALLRELKSLAASHKAWFVFGKFDQYRQDSPSAALDAFQGLGRQLLAEPEECLVQYRERICAAMGSNLGLGPSLLPEFELLLGKHPAIELSEAAEAEARTAQASLALLRAVASAARPVVLVYDDLQWAPNVSLRILDSIVTNPEPIPGLLLVCAYRATDVSEKHALRQLIERWELIELAPPELKVDNLLPAAASDFVGAMLRLPTSEASKLSAVLSERAQNNPYNTVELINALRQDGLLTPSNGVWEWDAATIRRHVGNSSLVDLLNRRIGKLPAESIELLQQVACLGGEVNQDVLELASGLSMTEVQQRLAPGIDDGLLSATTEAEQVVIRFMNGRVQQAVFEGMAESVRQQMHLSLARHLNSHLATRPDLDAAISEQYLPAAVIITDEPERRLAVGFFSRTAKRLRLLNGAVAQRFLSAAIELLKLVETTADNDPLFDLEAAHHRALFGLGRLDEVDATYASLTARTTDPVRIVDATRIQMYSFNSRRRFPDSLALGLKLLERVGLVKPADIRPDLAAGFKRLAAFAHGEDKLRDFDRPEAQDKKILVWSSIVPHTTTPAFYCDVGTWAWLTLENHRLWMEYGPSRNLLSGICATPSLLVGTPQDYRGAYVMGRHIVAVGEARDYQPSVSYARCMFALAAGHWFESLEQVIEEFRRSRADLLRLGDEQFFLSTFVLFDAMLDSSPTLEAPLAEVDTGLGYAARSGNIDFRLRYQLRKQLILALRGETKLPGSFETDLFDETIYLQSIDLTGLTAWNYHVFSAIGALLFNDVVKLANHALQAMALMARAPGYYYSAIARVLQAVSLGEKARALPMDERLPVIEELDNTCLKWLTARAADAPFNFLHMQRWVEAERAWAADSVWVAGQAFDAAIKEAALHQRTWHRAIINERAALFHLQHGLEQSGRAIFTQAYELYTSWGAVGKANELRRQHSFLRAGRAKNEDTANGTLRGTTVDADTVDMMAVLRASQALSSETSLVSLTAQVGKVLGAITGATGVQLIVKGEEGSDRWVMANSLAAGVTPITVEEAGAKGEVPFTVFRYAERTAQVLVLEDVVRDDRFSSDPYAEQHDQCSLMLVPILKQGQLNGMLVLENNQRRGAFSADRLDSVAMIAGQLSVSLDNALLYASLEKRVAERTAQLRQKTNDVNAMLQNMPQGVLTVVHGGVIHPEYSAYLETIFETKDVANRNVMELVFGKTNLSDDVLSQVDAAIGSCIGEDEMNFEFNSHLLVTEFDLTLPAGKKKSVALSWSPIGDEQGTVDKLMLCVRDVTELKQLAAEASTRKGELQMIGEILAVSQEKFHAFVDSARAFVDENKQLIEKESDKQPQTINLLFRNMHTIKGNARTYGLLGLTNLVHGAEQSYDDLRKQDELPWNPTLLLTELAVVKAAIEKYSHVNDTVLGRKGPGRRTGAETLLMVEQQTVQNALARLRAVDTNDIVSLRNALASVGSTLNLIGTHPLREILADTLDSLPSLAKELGREAPQVTIEDHGIVIRTQASNMLRNLFTHLLRNSIDHGIEPPDERKAKGKSPLGHIGLALGMKDGKLQIHLHDDGRGLPIAKIRQRALEQELLANECATPEEVSQLIFRAGFSTAEQVTEVSGRGVGMDAVRGLLEQEGGSIAIRFLDNNQLADFRPFETVIGLPENYAASSSDALNAPTQERRK